MARDDDDDVEGRDESDKIDEKKSKKGKLTDDEKMWGMLAHLAVFVAVIIGPLIIWQIKKDGAHERHVQTFRRVSE